MQTGRGRALVRARYSPGTGSAGESLVRLEPSNPVGGGNTMDLVTGTVTLILAVAIILSLTLRVGK